jgi:hypothetical protein
VVQYLTYLNPLRYFMEIVRGVFIKGVGVTVLWPQMLADFQAASKYARNTFQAGYLVAVRNRVVSSARSVIAST